VLQRLPLPCLQVVELEKPFQTDVEAAAVAAVAVSVVPVVVPVVSVVSAAAASSLFAFSPVVFVVSAVVGAASSKLFEQEGQVMNGQVFATC